MDIPHTLGTIRMPKETKVASAVIEASTPNV